MSLKGAGSGADREGAGFSVGKGEVDATVRLDSVWKTYRPGLLRPRVSALCGMSLRVLPGEVYALIGPNGAGKTTVFRILLGLVRPDRGHGEILGFPIGSAGARRHLGFLPEAPCYYPFLTVRELLRLAAHLSMLPDASRAVERNLESFGLVHLQDRPLRRLSKGQLQRVGIAQASLHDPHLLILDEPMSGLDPLGRARVKDWIRSLRSEGRTVLLASHILADVEALADRVGLIQEGRITAEGSAESLLKGSEEEVEVEFVLNGDPNPILAGLGASLEDRSGLWGAILASGQEIHVSALLARILGHGGTIRSVGRRRRSLESFYVASVQERERAGRRVQEGR